MFNNSFPYSNNMYNSNGYMPNQPIPTQYGNYNAQQPTYTQQPQPQQQPITNTNKIFVNGLEDVKNRMLPNNSDYIFMDNDNPLIYRKVVDSTGRMNVEVFEIKPYQEKKTEQTKNVDMSNYVLKSDFDKLSNEIAELKSKFHNNVGNTNGSTKQSRANNKET